MKKLPFALIFSLAFLLSACRDEPKTPAGGEAETANPHKPVVKKTEVRLVCQEVNEPNQEPGYPQNEVFLYLAESKVKVADIQSCEDIAPSDFQNYDIPANAIVAVGGWWAGAGDYVYVTKENGNFIVMKGEIFEESEDGSYNYQEVMKFTEKGVEVF